MKALWINPLTTGSTSLDTTINPHDVDQLALSHLLEREGFEVWLQESFSVKKSMSSYPRVVHPQDLPSFDADIAIISATTFTLDYTFFRYYEEQGITARAKKLDKVTDWLDRFKGELYIFITDPRPNFQSMFLSKRKKWHRFHDHIDRARLLVADPSFLHRDLKARGLKSDYWKAVCVGEPKTYNADNSYFCIYPGMQTQKAARKKMVANWLDTSGCFTMGEIMVPGLSSLSDYKKVSLSQVLDLTNQSTTSLICGEPTHTWLTPRVIQSLVCGTICSIHPEFAGSHHLPPDMVLEQTVVRASEFDVKLNEEVYQRQVDFAMSLYSGDAKSGVV